MTQPLPFKSGPPYALAAATYMFIRNLYWRRSSKCGFNLKGKLQERERFLVVRDVENHLARPSKVLQISIVGVFSQRLQAEECTEYGSKEYMSLIPNITLEGILLCSLCQVKMRY